MLEYFDATSNLKPVPIPTSIPIKNTITDNLPAPVSAYNEGNWWGLFFIGGVLSSYLLIFIVIWVITGLIGFISSLICFGFYGSISDKIIGLIVAFLLGPIYWLYFSLNKDYCTIKPRIQVF